MLATEEVIMLTLCVVFLFPFSALTLGSATGRESGLYKKLGVGVLVTI